MNIGIYFGNRVYKEIHYIHILNSDLSADKLSSLVYYKIKDKKADMEVMVREIRFDSNPFRQLWT